LTRSEQNFTHDRLRQGEGSNMLDLHDAAGLDAQLAGDLCLLAESKLRTSGCHVPMLCDRAAPDLGYPA